MPRRPPKSKPPKARRRRPPPNASPPNADEIATQIAKAAPIAAKEPAHERPALRLIPQPNGRGALLSRGVVGHRSPPGRPPAPHREQSRALFAKWSIWADRTLDAALKATAPGAAPAGEDAPKPPEPITLNMIADRAIKVGFPPGDLVPIVEVRARLTRQLDAIERAFDPDLARRIEDVIRPVWQPESA